MVGGVVAVAGQRPGWIGHDEVDRFVGAAQNFGGVTQDQFDVAGVLGEEHQQASAGPLHGTLDEPPAVTQALGPTLAPHLLQSGSDAAAVLRGTVLDDRAATRTVGQSVVLRQSVEVAQRVRPSGQRPQHVGLVAQHGLSPRWPCRRPVGGRGRG